MTKTLKWVLSPLGSFPGFCEAVFAENGKLFIQKYGIDKKIETFDEISLDDDSTLLEVETKERKPGDHGIFSFLTPEGNVIVGDYTVLKAYFSTNIKKYRKLPFLCEEIGEFLDNGREIQQAMLGISSILGEISPLSDVVPVHLNERLGQSNTILQPDTTIIGNLVSRGAIYINGAVCGDLHCSLVTVGDAAQVNGSILANEVVVAGRVDGWVRSNRVVLKDSAQVKGDIFHRSLVMEQGAIFDGMSRPTDRLLPAGNFVVRTNQAEGVQTYNPRQFEEYPEFWDAMQAVVEQKQQSA